MNNGKVVMMLLLLVLGTTSCDDVKQKQKQKHRNAYATMMYMGTPRDYEFYVATRVMLRSLAKLQVHADLVVIASLDVPLRWIQAMYVSFLSLSHIISSIAYFNLTTSTSGLRPLYV